MGIEAILALAGLVVPPAFQLVKSWFAPSADTPEAVASTLATTKPETLGPYVESIAKLKDAETRFFNRDVLGTPSQFIVDLRAIIRPSTVVIALLALVAEGLSKATSSWAFTLEAGTRGLFVLAVSQWFSGRIFNGKS